MYISTSRWFLLGLITTSILSIGLFLNGFLLTKTEMKHTSLLKENKNLDEIFKDIKIDDKNHTYQSLLDQYHTIMQDNKKVLLFIIDALRYDIFQPNEKMEIMCENTMNLDSLNEKNEKYMKRNITHFTKDELMTLRFKYNNNFPDVPKLNYTSCIYNQFPLLHELLLKSRNAILYKAYADPPTTTSQRLKGITTGSIPAFIEFSSNFDSTVITEDNIIHQALQAGKKVAVIGDDTWEKLFPSQFDLSLPFDSFNTMDLDTVDNGVEDALNGLIENNTLLDYDLVVAHFLGVDHIGHTHSAFDILMGERYLAFNVVHLISPIFITCMYVCKI